MLQTYTQKASFWSPPKPLIILCFLSKIRQQKQKLENLHCVFGHYCHFHPIWLNHFLNLESEHFTLYYPINMSCCQTNLGIVLSYFLRKILASRYMHLSYQFFQARGQKLPFFAFWMYGCRMQIHFTITFTTLIKDQLSHLRILTMRMLKTLSCYKSFELKWDPKSTAVFPFASANR